MNRLTVEVSWEGYRVQIQLIADTSRGDALQLPIAISERVEDEASIDAIQITAPVTSMQSILVTRTVVPVQETNKQASAEMVLPKVS